MVGLAKMMSSSGCAQTVIRVDDPSQVCAAGETGGAGGGVGVCEGVGEAAGIVVVVSGDGAGGELDAGSGRNSANANTPATAATTSAAIAIAAIRPACPRRGRSGGDEARDIGTFRAASNGDPAVRHDLEAAGHG
ncbi:hypothetical protein MTE01_00760 [Microbacterium testaceum]|uniref:Uncharacterized protein n=1 Tax=Microbacterium testaceum TaxID=2033 RepID=A0A4Y3QG24_MICTE|nr:hypothetical protein MTE01_00760 [Microbacterium testaceum]